MHKQGQVQYVMHGKEMEKNRYARLHAWALLMHSKLSVLHMCDAICSLLLMSLWACAGSPYRW